MPVHRSLSYSAAYQIFTLGNWYFALSDATSFAEDQDVNSIFATEIVGFNGYTSPALTYGTPTWDVVTQQYIAPLPTLTYGNAGTTTIQYISYFGVCCPSGHTRIVPKAVTQTNFSGATNTITLTSHGYTNNDRVVFRVVSGTIDSAINTSLGYYVMNATTNTFQLSVDQVNPLDLAGNGASLNAYIIDRSLDETRGGIVYQTFAVPTSVAPGNSVNFILTTATDSLE
jgi:hypothetical protein